MSIAQSQKIVKFITLALCYIIRIIPSRPVFAIVKNQLDKTFSDSMEEKKRLFGHSYSQPQPSLHLICGTFGDPFKKEELSSNGIPRMEIEEFIQVGF